MHSCPECGQACDCDGEDLWIDENDEDCTHDCDPRDLDDEEAQELLNEIDELDDIEESFDPIDEDEEE